ncbi:MAG: hypothetical protein ACQEXJ_04730 [Myxococcota bacterium]
MTDTTREERFHTLRRALHTASLQLEVARTLVADDEGPAGRALRKSREALSRAAGELEALEEEERR